MCGCFIFLNIHSHKKIKVNFLKFNTIMLYGTKFWRWQYIPMELTVSDSLLNILIKLLFVVEWKQSPRSKNTQQLASLRSILMNINQSMKQQPLENTFTLKWSHNLLNSRKNTHIIFITINLHWQKDFFIFSLKLHFNIFVRKN